MAAARLTASPGWGLPTHAQDPLLQRCACSCSGISENIGYNIAKYPRNIAKYRDDDIIKKKSELWYTGD